MERTEPADWARPAMLDRERGALALFALSGAVFLPDAFDRFDFPKLAACAAAIALALSVAPRGRLPRVVRLAVVAGLILLSVKALGSSAALVRLIGRAPRYEGLIGLSVYVGAAAAGARLLGPRRPSSSLTWLLDWLAIAALAVAVEAVLETAGLFPLQSNVFRPGSLLGNASDEGAWAVLALGPLTPSGLCSRRLLHLAGAFAAAVALDCSASRGGYLGGIVAMILLVPLLPGSKQRAALAGFATLAVVGVFLLPASRGRVTGTSPLATETVSGRQLLWGESLRLIDDHPLLGIGAGGFVDTLPRYQTLRYEREIGPQTLPDSPENWLLQAAVAGGVPLLLISLGLAGLVLLRGHHLATGRAEAGGVAGRAGETGEPVEMGVTANSPPEAAGQPRGLDRTTLAGMLAGLAGYGVALLFYFTSPASTPLAVMFAGVLLAEASPIRTLTGALRRRAGPTLAFALLTLLLAAAAFAEIPLRAALVAAGRGEVGPAEADFRAARALRPWDPQIAADAGHAFAELASAGISDASAIAAPWTRRALSATPGSVQVIADQATIDLARGDARTAGGLLDHALTLDPLDGPLRLSAAGAALVLGERHKAIQLAEEARVEDPDDPRVASILAAARRPRHPQASLR